MSVSDMGVALTLFAMEMAFGFIGFFLGKLLWHRVSESSPKGPIKTRVIRR